MHSTAFPQYYKANGKLLLTAEYFVLDGAKALAMPSKFYQEMQVLQTETEGILWESYDEKNELWFTCHFNKNIELSIYSDEKVAKTLQNIILKSKEKTKAIDFNNIYIKTKVNFNRSFGLGTSSTLISLVAQWLNVNPYFLLKNSFGGSGYDIACATAKNPITYQYINNERKINDVAFAPSFSNAIFFIYLDKKQDSRNGIQHYKNIAPTDKTQTIDRLSSITDEFLSCNNILIFNNLIEEHEHIIASQLQMTPIKQQLFSNFEGSIKSLGAWGGDFVMACSSNGSEYIKSYFLDKKYNNIIPFNDMF